MTPKGKQVVKTIAQDSEDRDYTPPFPTNLHDGQGKKGMWMTPGIGGIAQFSRERTRENPFRVVRWGVYRPIEASSMIIKTSLD